MGREDSSKYIKLSREVKHIKLSREVKHIKLSTKLRIRGFYTYELWMKF